MTFTFDTGDIGVERRRNGQLAWRANDLLCLWSVSDGCQQLGRGARTGFVFAVCVERGVEDPMESELQVPEARWVNEVSTVLRDANMDDVPHCLTDEGTSMWREERHGACEILLKIDLCSHESVEEVARLMCRVVMSETYASSGELLCASDATVGKPEMGVCCTSLGSGSTEDRVTWHFTFFPEGWWKPRWYRGDGQRDHLKLDYRLLTHWTRCVEPCCLATLRSRHSSAEVTVQRSRLLPLSVDEFTNMPKEGVFGGTRAVWTESWEMVRSDSRV